MSTELLSRIRRKSLQSKIMQAEDTIPFIRNGMDLGWSGFTPAGYSKVVPAALRSLCPRERAREIIAKCVHPDYKPILQDYYERAEKICFEHGIGHEPHMLYKVFKMQEHLETNGTMKIGSWL